MQSIFNTRREFIAGVSAAAALSHSGLALAQSRMPARTVPSTGESLPVIGLGSSKVVQGIATEGKAPLASVLRTLVSHGGSVVDTWPRNPSNDGAFGEVISEPDLRDVLFVTTKIDQVGEQAGIDQFRLAQRLYKRETMDLTQVFSLTDLAVHWPNLKRWKAEGQTRYIGVTVAEYGLYPALEEFLQNEKPDFVQINYSITERRAEDRILPLLQDLGVAVIVNRPFMNGAYFSRLEDRTLPAWSADFDCETWAQFSLKYILANPAITCILTETSNPEHMAENALTALGRTPDGASRARMRDFIDTV
jgi:diketogulonate reductase-like aldo/keto reductase